MATQLDMQPPPFVLFADDSEDTLDLMRKHAEDLNWNGSYATDAIAIMDLVNENCCTEGKGCYDVIVADVNYLNAGDEHGPSISGITAARQIRKVHEDVPIIFLTGYDDPLIRHEIKRINGILVKKPVDCGTLFKQIWDLAVWHRANHIQHAGSGVPPSDSSGADLRIDHIHTSNDGGKLSVPRGLDDVFKLAVQDSLSRPRLTLKHSW